LDKIIVTAMLMMAGVISAITFFNSVYPAISQGGDAIKSMEYRVGDRLKSQINIIHAANSNGTVSIWVKNVGDVRVAGMASSDLFFGPEGNFNRIPYGAGAPHWEYVVENDSEWNPRATIRVIIFDYSPLNPGRYYVKMVLPNGIADDDFFSW